MRPRQIRGRCGRASFPPQGRSACHGLMPRSSSGQGLLLSLCLSLSRNPFPCGPRGGVRQGFAPCLRANPGRGHLWDRNPFLRKSGGQGETRLLTGRNEGLRQSMFPPRASDHPERRFFWQLDGHRPRGSRGGASEWPGRSGWEGLGLGRSEEGLGLGKSEGGGSLLELWQASSLPRHWYLANSTQQTGKRPLD